MTQGNRTVKPDCSRIEIISVHVPKTGGTTFKKVLKQVYQDEEIFFDYPHKGPIRNKLLTSDRSLTRVIHGHFPGNKYDYKYPHARKIIWLRNPINRLISHYFFWKSWQVLTFPQETIEEDELARVVEFAERPEVRNILAANFLQNQSLTDFYFVGIQEFFREDLVQLEQCLKWPNFELEDKNKNPYPEYQLLLKKLLESSEIISKIGELNREDREIYREALSLREERINKLNLGNNIWINNGKTQIVEKNSLENNRKIIEPLISWGSIDRIVIQNQVLGLSGWVASWKSGPVEGLKVVIGDREYTFFEKLLCIPSPDV
ncbi:MAG: sulfotransferase family protein, partial [Okeania sp. SIO2H7]|nr:sulfotransferase family protein [Okeania sp. SIO2H7]